MNEVPVIVLRHPTETQKRALVIADNQLAIAGAGWDAALLGSELDGLKPQLAEARRERDESAKSVLQLKTQVQSLETDVTKLEQNLASTQGELAGAREQQAQLNDAVASLQKSFAALDAECEGLKTERDKWSKKSGQQHVEMEALREKLNEAVLACPTGAISIAEDD